MRLQIRELLDRAFKLAVAVLVHEAEREELICTVVVLRIPHGGLLWHTDHVAGWHIASIRELEVFQDLSLDRY